MQSTGSPQGQCGPAEVETLLPSCQCFAFSFLCRSSLFSVHLLLRISFEVTARDSTVMVALNFISSSTEVMSLTVEFIPASAEVDCFAETDFSSGAEVDFSSVVFDSSLDDVACSFADAACSFANAARFFANTARSFAGAACPFNDATAFACSPSLCPAESGTFGAPPALLLFAAAPTLLFSEPARFFEKTLLFGLFIVTALFVFVAKPATNLLFFRVLAPTLLQAIDTAGTPLKLV